MSLFRSAFVVPLVSALAVGVAGSVAAQTPPVVIKTFWGPGPERKPPPQTPPSVLREVAQDAIELAAPAITRGRAATRAPAEADKPGRASTAKHSIYVPAIRGVDPMVAAGRNYMIVSQQAEMMFLDKNGARLPEKNGIPTHVWVGDVFGAFTEPGGQYDLNQHAGFSTPCDAAQYPETRGRKFCIGEFYDLRVHFDAGADRFMLLAAVRNPVWTEVFRKGWKEYTNTFGACGVYAPPTGGAKPLPNPTQCYLARRLHVFGLSKTEDPRDGFHIYATTENNYRDWPWASVNAEGNTFVLGARGIETDAGPAVKVFALEDLRAGNSTPRSYTYRPSELGTIGRRVAPIVLHGAAAGLGGHTLAVSRLDARRLEIYAFPAPTHFGIAPPMLKTTVTFPEGVSLHSWLGAAVYRNGFIHATWAAAPSAVAASGVWNLRFPISIAQGKLFVPPLSASTPGYRYRIVGKEGLASAAFPDFAPAIAVNAKGDVMTGYARRISDTQLQVRYALWRSEAASPEPSVGVDVTPGTPASGEGKIDYAWSVVDPADDLTFWLAHDYRWSSAGNNTVLVKILPN